MAAAPATMSVNNGDYNDSDDSFSENNPLYGHPHYAPVKTLSRGPAGSLQVNAPSTPHACAAAGLRSACLLHHLHLEVQPHFGNRCRLLKLLSLGGMLA